MNRALVTLLIVGASVVSSRAAKGQPARYQCIFDASEARPFALEFTVDREDARSDDSRERWRRGRSSCTKGRKRSASSSWSHPVPCRRLRSLQMEVRSADILSSPQTDLPIL